MIKIRDFDNYYFCPRTAGVYRRKGAEWVRLQPTQRIRSEIAFILSKNGVGHLKFLGEILLENQEEILKFLASSRRKNHDVDV